jgi:very-short-patch-repair endonuclease
MTDAKEPSFEELYKASFLTQLSVWAMLIKKHSELAVEALEQDIARFNSLHPVCQAYIWAYWHTYLPTRKKPKVDVTGLPPNLDQVNAMVPVFLEVFGSDFFDSMGPPKPSDELKNDVAKRLEWLKRCVGKDFERAVLSLVDRHNVVSPIEQIFLMEWCYAKVEERFALKLHPQKPIRTASGQYVLDYVVTATDDSSPKFAVAIELDGHEFHEKTKEQVIQDNRRERAILQAGVKEGLRVLRFSGSEVVRNCKGCIKEVVAFIDQMRDIG